MRLMHDNVKRCGIFLFFDKQGIVDDYVLFLLEEIKKSVEDILIVSNGSLSEEARDKFSKVTNWILVRENTGFDVAGYKEALFYIGFDKLCEYDEVVLLNYTFFGPLYPFEEMFCYMEDRDVDFWGITKHYAVYPDPFGKNKYGYMPEHLQSHFLVIRKSMMMSSDYQKFMITLPNPTSYVESICNYESIFTKNFEDLGFKWESYCDSDEYEDYVYNPVMFGLNKMIRKQRCPIIKRRSFFTDYQDFMLNSCGESTVDALEYVEKNLDYNFDMVWDNLLRLENMSCIARAMQLQYVIPENVIVERKIHKSICIVLYIESLRWIKTYLPKLLDLKDISDFVVLTKRERINEVREETKELGCEVKEVRDIRDIFSKEKGIVNESYDYYGVVSLHEVEKVIPYSNDFAKEYSDWVNIVPSKSFVMEVINLFEKYRKLGLLVPPKTDFGRHYGSFGEFWKQNFARLQNVLIKNGVSNNISAMEEPLSPTGGCFWMAGAAFASLINRDFDELIEEVREEEFFAVLPILIQNLKYYTAYVHNSSYMPIEITNEDFQMRELNKVVFASYGPNYHSVVVEKIKNNENLRNNSLESSKKNIKRIIKKILKKIIPNKILWKLVAVRNRIKNRGL